jgi:hypothetical protein
LLSRAAERVFQVLEKHKRAFRILCDTVLIVVVFRIIFRGAAAASARSIYQTHASVAR